MSSFLVLSEGDTRNRWRDGQVCPDVGQGTMAPWARRLGNEGRREEREKEKKKVERERMEGEGRGDGRRRERRRQRRRKEKSGGNGRKEKVEETEERESGRERAEPALYGEKG
ncbi:hypothetical protein TNCV_5035181 [Trichonephila clavipes]|nr:hypothetical protein TNCV_5035181 [Trichonephila clavipes]